MVHRRRSPLHDPVYLMAVKEIKCKEEEQEREEKQMRDNSRREEKRTEERIHLIVEKRDARDWARKAIKSTKFLARLVQYTPHSHSTVLSTTHQFIPVLIIVILGFVVVVWKTYLSKVSIHVTGPTCPVKVLEGLLTSKYNECIKQLHCK